MIEKSSWIIVRIDGKIAALSQDYRQLRRIATHLAGDENALYGNISATTISFEEIMQLKGAVTWDDFLLFGTPFQNKVWRKLFELSPHDGSRPQLISYSEFASFCGCPSGARAVAHAVGLNPVAVLIPCHLIVPKETIVRINEIRNLAQSTIFKGEDISTSEMLSDKAIDYGEYALGRELKRALILLELGD